MVKLINNKGIKNLNQLFREELLTCSAFNIASAFITDSGVELLVSFTKNNKYRFRKGRLLISLYNCFNSKHVLSRLKALNGNRISVRISKNKRFHWKYYQFQHKKFSSIYIGSANFTDGLVNIGELTNTFTVTLKEQAQVVTLFDKEWDESFSIQDFPINKYKEFRPKISELKLHADINKLFEKKSTISVSKTIGGIILLNSKFSKATEKIVKQNQAHWYLKDWHYFSCLTKMEFEKCKKMTRFLLIEYYNRKYKFVLSEKMAEDTFRTSEGNYFIAYREIRKKKGETNQIRKVLNEMNVLYRSKTFALKSLRERQSEILKEIFR